MIMSRAAAAMAQSGVCWPPRVDVEAIGVRLPEQCVLGSSKSPDCRTARGTGSSTCLLISMMTMLKGHPVRHGPEPCTLVQTTTALYFSTPRAFQNITCGCVLDP